MIICNPIFSLVDILKKMINNKDKIMIQNITYLANITLSKNYQLWESLNHELLSIEPFIFKMKKIFNLSTKIFSDFSEQM